MKMREINKETEFKILEIIIERRKKSFSVPDLYSLILILLF